MHVLGIDVGQKGAISYLGLDGNSKTLAISVTDMPFSRHNKTFDLSEALSFVMRRTLNVDKRPIHVFIELVHAYGGQGVCSMFSFGRGFGFVETFAQTLQFLSALKGIDCHIYTVHPKTWQAIFGLTDLKVTKDEKKLKHAVKLLSIYPDLKDRVFKTNKLGNETLFDGIVDATLIAEFGRRVLKGEVDFKSATSYGLTLSDDTKESLDVLAIFEEEVEKYLDRLQNQKIRKKVNQAHALEKDKMVVKRCLKKLNTIKRRWRHHLKDFREFKYNF